MSAVATALATAVAPARAGAADLSGEWKHKRTKLTFNITAWGDECGPRPQTVNRKERGTVTVSEAGGKIELKKRRWKFGSHRCLSQNPELKFKGYDAGSRTTKCATPAGSAKGEKGSYALKTPDDNTIRYEGSTVYDWSLKGVSCKATMKEVQLFERVVQTPPPPPPVAAPEPAPAPTPEPVPEPVVAQEEEVIEEVVDEVTGKVTRRRKKKGGGYVLDLEGAAGRGGAGGLGGLTDERRQVGKGTARRGAGLALGIVLATVAISLFAGAFLLVSRRRRRRRGPSGGSGGGGGGGHRAEGGGGESDEDRLGASAIGEQPRPPPASRRGGGAGAAQISSRPPRERGPGSGALAPPPPPVSQSGAGGRMLCPKCDRDYDPAERFCPYDAAKLQRASAAAPSEEFVLSPRLICRTCLREFPLEHAAGASRCPEDGDRLLPLVGAEARNVRVGVALEIAAEDEAPGEAGPDNICPRCSVRYPAQVLYCGKDGADLVSIN